MTYDLDAICRPIPRCRRWVRSRCCVRTRWSCRPATLCAPACNRTWSGLQPHVVRPATLCIWAHQAELGRELAERQRLILLLAGACERQQAPYPYQGRAFLCLSVCLSVHGKLHCHALVLLRFYAAILLHRRISKVRARQSTLNYASYNYKRGQWIPISDTRPASGP